MLFGDGLGQVWDTLDPSEVSAYNAGQGRTVADMRLKWNMRLKWMMN